MPLPPDSPQRQLKHRRRLDIEIYSRPDGLWEVEAELTDTKTRVAQMVDGPREPGVPIHQLRLRLVVNRDLDIVEAGSSSPWVPYAGHCGEHGDAYSALAGLNLTRGFRKAVHERLGGVRGCTHLSELAQTLPTAVIQGMVGEVLDVRGTAPDARQPFQIDRCHALRGDGEVVRLHYPRWHRQASAKNAADNQPVLPNETPTPRSPESPGP